MMEQKPSAKKGKNMFSINTIKSLVIAFVVSATVVGLPSCSPEEQGVAGGVIAGALVGAAIANGPSCHAGYRRVCEGYHDYYGYYHQRCRRVWDSCAYYRGNEEKVSPRVEQFANKYNLSIDAGQKVIAVLDQVTAGDLNAWKNIGLTKDNISSFAQMSTPSEQSLNGVAQNLNVSTATVHDMVSDIVVRTKAQLADVSSTYWTNCMKSGSWKTDRNSVCHQTSWRGCTPESGATYCIAQ